VKVHEALAPQPQDFVLERTVGIDGSYGMQLYPVLRQLGRTTLLMTGMSTNLAVEGHRSRLVTSCDAVRGRPGERPPQNP
jgi:isochorismate hydrolase